VTATCIATAANLENAVEPAAPIGGLDEISQHHSELALNLCTVEQLALLLETLSDKAYSNAAATQKLAGSSVVVTSECEWQMRWWEQAQCIATLLEKVAKELETSNEAIYSVVYGIQRQGRTL
jgi:hypothetical protein